MTLKALDGILEQPLLLALHGFERRMIVERQEAEGWGRSVVERLAQDLQAELPGVQGFSVSSLWYMRKLFLAYRDKEILQPLAGEIGWTHDQVILDRWILVTMVATIS